MRTVYRLNKKGTVYEAYKTESKDMSNVEYGKDFYQGVESPIDGYHFKGKKDYNEYLKRNNLILRK